MSDRKHIWDRDRQQISELMDAQLAAEPARDLLQRLASDPSLRSYWRSYQLVGHAMRRDVREEESSADEAFVSSVMARIQAEEAATATRVSSKVVPLHPSAAPIAGTASGDAVGSRPARSRMPLAIAASFVFASLGAGLLFSQVADRPSDDLTVAAVQTPTAQAERSPAPLQTLTISNPETRSMQFRQVQSGSPALQTVAVPTASRGVGNAQLNAYLLTHSNQPATSLSGAFGLVRVAAHTQSGGR